ncbi:hypothetical protein Tco_0027183 [Tanacetum coccineum]
MTEFPQMDSGLAVPIFNQGDDPITCLNKAMAFLIVVASSSYASTSYKGNATSYGENNIGGQTKFKKKAMLAEAQESGQILDEEQLAFLADPGIPDGQAAQKTIPNTDSFQTEDLNAYDSDCDDVSNGFEQTPVVDFTDNEITSDSNIIPYSQYLKETQQAAIQDTNLYAQQANKKNNESLTAELERYKERVKTFEQRLNIDLSTREKMIDSQMYDMIKEKLALK